MLCIRTLGNGSAGESVCYIKLMTGIWYLEPIWKNLGVVDYNCNTRTPTVRWNGRESPGISRASYVGVCNIGSNNEKDDVSVT